MRRSSWMVCALLAAAAAACRREPPPPADTASLPPAETLPAGDTATAPPAPEMAPPPAAEPRRPAIQQTAAPPRDVPYVSSDTGTIAPGMSESDVVGMWGKPVAVSRTGSMTFLYFMNSCEYTCGTLDVVFLDNGQVVDAVLRWPGHSYSGESSSPPGSVPAPTPAGQPAPAAP